MVDSLPLKERALQLGFSGVGVCHVDQPLHLSAYESWLEKGFHGTMSYMVQSRELRSSARTILPDAQRVIAVRLNYRTEIDNQPGQPKIARYARGRDYHRVLRGKLAKLAKQMAVIYPESKWRACVDSAPILEREYSHYAGLGWFGKNTMLIDSRVGSWFFLGLLLTDVPFLLDEPSEGGCGSCQACISACPTGAIVFDDGRWQINSNLCISYLTIEHRGLIDPALTAKMGDWTFGCDICQEVCPFNQPRDSQPLRAPITQEPDFLGVRSWPSLKELASVSEEEWDSMSKGSAVRRATRSGIQRNASINFLNAENSMGVKAT